MAGGRFEARKHHQIANFQDFCNDCGNCDTFCPEDGGPYLEKPRFFGSLEAWQRAGTRDGFFVERRGRRGRGVGRLRGVEYLLEVDRPRDRAVFTDGRVTARAEPPRAAAGGGLRRPALPTATPGLRAPT